MTTQTIALSQLVPSPDNVRKTKTGIEGLAANIEALGLLQNLQVRPANGKGFEVVAGGRRLAALQLLAKRKKIAPDHPVMCEIRDGAIAVEISLAENEMREAMHPADQFEAFKKLAGRGQGRRGDRRAFRRHPAHRAPAPQARRGEPETYRRLPQDRPHARLPDGLHGVGRSPAAGKDMEDAAGLRAAAAR
jgi:ParB-like nuclease domain